MDLSDLVLAPIMTQQRTPRRRQATLLLFLILGGGLFALAQLFGDPQANASAPIVVTASQIEATRARLQRQYGRAPSPSEEEAAVERLVREAMLVDEARRLGLHRGDLVVRRRLLEKMELLAPEGPAGAQDRFHEALELGLDRDDLIVRRRLVQQMERLAVIEGGPVRLEAEQERDYYERHRERFVAAPRYGFQHVFVSRNDRDRAARGLEALRAGQPDATSRWGDAFPLGTVIPPRSVAKIAADGVAFAEALVDAPVGHWHGPVASSFGWHLVLVKTVEPEVMRPLDEVRVEIRHALRAKAEQRRIDRMITRLRASCQIEVRWPASEATS